MKKIVYLLSIVLSFNLYSCRQSEETKREQREARQTALEDSNKKVGIALLSKYRAFDFSKSRSDSPLFTYELQNKFIDEKTPVFFEGSIFDIIRVDSCYILKVKEKSIYEYSWCANIKISKKVLDSISDKKLLIYRKDAGLIQGYFIVKVNKILPVYLDFIPTTEGEDEDNFIEIDKDYTSRNLPYIINGSLIDFAFQKNE